MGRVEESSGGHLCDRESGGIIRGVSAWDRKSGGIIREASTYDREGGGIIRGRL